MSKILQRELWDVTYILPKGKQAIYRQVPLHNLNEIFDLTRDVGVTSMRYLSNPSSIITSSSEIDDLNLIPGFIIYHMPPPEKMEILTPLNLTSNEMNWSLLLQRQGETGRILLQIVPSNNNNNEKQNNISSSSNKGIISPIKNNNSSSNSSSSVKSQESTNHSSNIVNISQISPKVSKKISKEEVKLKKFQFMNENIKKNNNFNYSNLPRRELPVKITNLKEQMDSYLQTKNKSSFKKSNTSVHVLALTYVLKKIKFLINEYNTKKEYQNFFIPQLRRNEIIYFAAAIVKYWQEKLFLTFSAMQDGWESLPPLIREAQYEFLENIVLRFWNKLYENYQYNKTEENNNNIHKEEYNKVLIKEVTYCNSTGPLPLPPCTLIKGNISITLREPQQCNAYEEIVIIGQIEAKNSVELFCWILDLGSYANGAPDVMIQGNSSERVLPLNNMYKQGLIKTFQITSKTFVIILKPGLLQPFFCYRVVVEICDRHIGDMAVFILNFCTLEDYNVE